jgi:hypothetical protein
MLAFYRDLARMKTRCFGGNETILMGGATALSRLSRQGTDARGTDIAYHEKG